MSARHLGLIVVGLSLAGLVLAAPTDAEPATKPQRTQAFGAPKSDVEDMLFIGDVALLYRRESLRSIEPVEPEKLQPVADAIESGLPSSSLQRLIRYETKEGADYLCCGATAIGAFGDFSAWQITWELIPEQGLPSGIPCRYVAYVRPDGTRVEPEIVLYNVFGLKSFAPDMFLHCALPLTSLRGQDRKAKAQEKEVQTAAHEALKKCLTANKLNDELRVFQAKQRSIPAALVEGNEVDPPITIWEVSFIESSTLNAAEQHVRLFRVWVTEDLRVGELSYGPWSTDVVSKAVLP